MKNLFESGILILIVILVAIIIFLHQCRGEDYYIPKDKVLISQSLYDSLKNFKPDTIINVTDTFTIKEPVYIRHDSLIYIEDSTGIKHYPDSIVNNDIRIWDDIYVQGIITKWDRRYEPVIHTITETVTVTVPQIVEQPVFYTDNGLYLTGIMGGNSNSFIFGAGLDLVTKKDLVYGFQYQRFGDQNFYSLRFGTKLNIFKHKK